MEVIDVELLQDYLTVGAVGFLLGVVAPMAFRVIGYIVDSVRMTLKGQY